MCVWAQGTGGRKMADWVEEDEERKDADVDR